MKPTGHVTLGRLLSSPRKTELREITEESFRTIPATQHEESGLCLQPVSPDIRPCRGRGRAGWSVSSTIDDAMIVLDEAAEEDLLSWPVWARNRACRTASSRTTKQRFPWLFVNLVTAILASLVIAQFEEAIAQIVALAVLMPIVASMGGNAGTQSAHRGGPRAGHARPDALEPAAGRDPRGRGGADQRGRLRGGDGGCGAGLVRQPCAGSRASRRPW